MKFKELKISNNVSLYYQKTTAGYAIEIHDFDSLIMFKDFVSPQDFEDIKNGDWNPLDGHIG